MSDSSFTSGAEKDGSADRHTAGPWEAVLVDDPRGQPVPYYAGLICTVEHGDRYLSVVADDDRSTSRDEWEANCRLIACAPEMLAALRKLERALLTDSRQKTITGDDVEYHLDGGSMSHAINTARTAIAKATQSPTPSPSQQGKTE